MTLPNKNERPKSLDKYVGNVRGVPAPGARIPVDTPNHDCQRPISISSLSKWAESAKEFDWNLFGYPTAVRYPDGSLKLINGQHRITLATWLVPELTEVPAHIIDAPVSDNPAEADRYSAYLFASMNGDKAKRLTPEDMLWAGIIAELPWAMETKMHLDACHLQCGRVNEGLYGNSVKRNVFEEALGFSKPGARWASELLSEVTPNGKLIDGQVLKGLSFLMSIKSKGKSVYADYADRNTAAGLEFYTWFKTLVRMTDIRHMQYGEFKTNADGAIDWHKGCAWGLVKEFNGYLVSIGKKHLCAPQSYAKKIWEGNR